MAHVNHREAAPRSIRVAVLTVSDTRTPDTDESGALIRDLSVGAGHRVVRYEVIPDGTERLTLAVREALDAGAEAVLVNGGTGLSGRDRSYEAIASLLDRRIDGFGELFRWLSFRSIGAAAMLSRAVAGLVDGRPVFSMPGSPAAVRLAMEELILPELGHVVNEARRAT
ncbi:MAG TPA: molybdenum cofactor biosynthesis protein B [Candidatus Polarisedimenticolia bacterium]|nr:molybdenum cofactor biosynthesis protein B [Candidatus Polarisedimenticolia bacterium]